jgi:hypothetical protein
LLASGASVLIVVSVIVLTAPRVASTAAVRAPRPPPADAGPACPPLELQAERAPASAALFVRGPAARVAVDGRAWSPGVRLLAGRHQLEVQGQGGQALSLPVLFAPFTTTLLEVREDPAALLPLLVGARCPGCDAPGEAELSFRPAEAPLDSSALALSRGRWRDAVDVLRRVPPARRDQPRVAAQLASALSLAGQPGRSPLLAPMVRAAKDREADERERELQWLRARWNAATDRFGEVALAMADEQPALVEAARARLEDMSSAFASAVERGDSAQQQALAVAADQVTASLARDLVALRPSDCAWRARLQQALGK